MKQIVILMFGLMLALAPQQANAQFLKKALKAVKGFLSDLGENYVDPNSPISLVQGQWQGQDKKKKKKKKDAQKNEEKETPEMYGFTAQLLGVDVRFVNYNTDFPLLNVSMQTTYSHSRGDGGTLSCYMFVDSAPIPPVTDYNALMELKETKCYGIINMQDYVGTVDKLKKSVDITIDARRLSNVPCEKLYLYGYIVHSLSETIMDTKSIEVVASKVMDIPSRESGQLGKILEMSVRGIRSFATCQKLYVDVTFWRQYTNTPFYCLLFVSENPIKANSIQELKPLLVKMPFGTGSGSAIRSSFDEQCIVSVPIPKAMLTKQIYLQGYAVTEQYENKNGGVVGKPIVAHKSEAIPVNLSNYEVLEGADTGSAFANVLTQTMFSALWGVDKNGNMICQSCDGIGCENCKWRGFNNKELMFFNSAKRR